MVYLFGMLCEKLNARANPDPLPFLQKWAGIVTVFWPKDAVGACLAGVFRYRM